MSQAAPFVEAKAVRSCDKNQSPSAMPQRRAINARWNDSGRDSPASQRETVELLISPLLLCFSCRASSLGPIPSATSFFLPGVGNFTSANLVVSMRTGTVRAQARIACAHVDL